MERISFSKSNQKKFIQRVCNGKSLMSFLKENNVMLNISYSSFKKYYSEQLTLPLSVFETLCRIGNI
ncbi:MAG: hypothetical protein J4452_00870, partial [Candidatus Aenigmarchaeota archaeon]|nr:hypothetical protein [Candidatus Aenigmarchaeota archaeon]